MKYSFTMTRLALLGAAATARTSTAFVATTTTSTRRLTFAAAARPATAFGLVRPQEEQPPRHVAFTTTRLFATSLIDKDEMSNILDTYETSGRAASGYCVVDVRNHDEIQDTGKLSPNIYTLPLGSILEEGALALPSEEFQAKHGFAKPAPEERVVFTCMAGKRAQKAADHAANQGYTNLIVYSGGSKEWFA